MNKAIQYREDGKFYGFYKPDQQKKFCDTMNFFNEYHENIAAGKEIINPDVLQVLKEGDVYFLPATCRNLKPGDIFNCPDNIEFESGYYCSRNKRDCHQGCITCPGDCIEVIHLKLKEEVKPVESPDATKELLLYINDLEIRTADEPLDNDEFIELIKSKFTIQRNI